MFSLSPLLLWPLDSPNTAWATLVIVPVVIHCCPADTEQCISKDTVGETWIYLSNLKTQIGTVIAVTIQPSPSLYFLSPSGSETQASKIL